MSAHEILIAVMAVFAVVGAVDRIMGNRWGLGKEFESGFLAMGRWLWPWWGSSPWRPCWRRY